MKALRAILWFVGIGFSPLWVSVAMVFFGSLSSSAGPGYWAVAPWLVIIAMKYCWITLIIAAITYGVFAIAPGSLARRFSLAALSFVIFSVLGAWWAWMPWQRRQVVKDQYQEEGTEGASYVEKHPLVAELLGSEFTVSLSESTVPEDPKADRQLVYYVYGSEKISDGRIVIVRVSHVSGTTKFELRCIAMQFAFTNREAGSDPCHPVFSASHPPPTDHEVVVAEEHP